MSFSDSNAISKHLLQLESSGQSVHNIFGALANTPIILNGTKEELQISLDTSIHKYVQE